MILNNKEVAVPKMDKKLLVFIRRFCSIVATLFIILLCVIFVVKFINSDRTRINSTNGIQESIYIDIFDTKQNLYIRGDDISNPIILFVHGGPGDPQPYMTYYFQTDLENDFTIAYWTQRNCGRNYYYNKQEGDYSTVDPDQVIADMDEVVSYLLKRFSKEKIIILGHSWGTIISYQYLQNYPEKVLSYIAVSQVVNTKEGLSVVAEATTKAISESGNKKDAENFSKIIGTLSLKQDFKPDFFYNYVSFKNLVAEYMPYEGQMIFLQKVWVGITAPSITLSDISWFCKIYAFTDSFIEIQRQYIEKSYIFNAYDSLLQCDVPICFITGEHDYITPHKLVNKLFTDMPSSDKKDVVVNNAGHSPFMDAPDEFCSLVKEFLFSHCY